MLEAARFWQGTKVSGWFSCEKRRRKLVGYVRNQVRLKPTCSAINISSNQVAEMRMGESRKFNRGRSDPGKFFFHHHIFFTEGCTNLT